MQKCLVENSRSLFQKRIKVNRIYIDKSELLSISPYKSPQIPLVIAHRVWKSKQNLILKLKNVLFTFLPMGDDRGTKVIYREKSIIIRFCRCSKFINLYRIYFYSFWNKDLLFSTRIFYKCGNCHLIISHAFISIWYFKKFSFLF